ncbi:DUF3306 domain-containing protein [uncultured Tateyamaria sp.]|uniref:DUF3306 domain-containing protein n=1 Tax=uncultured Tateyamaria sp. TaxID=455651 RepID=UPI00261121F6|nr:DUF3306 domain-containing protein [uncultured Tateyamaria sp.]
MSGRADFWARRRAGVAAEAQAEEAARTAEAQAQDHAALQEMDEAEMLAALNLPNPDTMVHGDDFSAFMATAVPDQIRRRALRTLWRSNPVLANVDMLVDYGEDFTDAAMAVENIQTAYQVGKGMLKHVEEMARQAAERDAPEAPDQMEEMEDDAPLIVADVIEDDHPLEATDAQLEHDGSAPSPAPRRMTFTIEDVA